MFDLFSAHQIYFQLFLEVAQRGKFRMLREISFQILRAEYENPFLAYSRCASGFKSIRFAFLVFTLGFAFSKHVC